MEILQDIFLYFFLSKFFVWVWMGVDGCGWVWMGVDDWIGDYEDELTLEHPTRQSIYPESR